VSKEKYSMKETDPYKYYRRQYRWLAVGKYVSYFLPIVAVLVWYIIASLVGGANTNPLNPFRFAFGFVLIFVVAFFMLVHELRKNNKQNAKEGNSLDFGGAIGCATTAIILGLLYITMFYLIILFVCEFVGQVAGSIFKYNQGIAKDKMDKVQTAEFNAEAIVREQNKKRLTNRLETNARAEEIE